jgi:hypothetical protein
MKKTSSTKSNLITIPDPGLTSVDKWIIAAQEAVRAALREHKRTGNHVAVWQDGQVVLIPPDKIEA